jgi:hypothetical protein
MPSGCDPSWRRRGAASVSVGRGPLRPGTPSQPSSHDLLPGAPRVAHLRWQNSADGSDTLAMAQVRRHRTPTCPFQPLPLVILQSAQFDRFGHHQPAKSSTTHLRIKMIKAAGRLCSRSAGLLFGWQRARIPNTDFDPRSQLVVGAQIAGTDLQPSACSWAWPSSLPPTSPTARDRHGPWHHPRCWRQWPCCRGSGRRAHRTSSSRSARHRCR